jgi:hypothetical protein
MERSKAISTSPRVKISGKQRLLNAVKDAPDLRDRWYEPSLVQLKPQVDNSKHAVIRDQGEDGACTGFGLAAVIDVLKRKNGQSGFRASTRMLYEMAKHHDEWPGFRYSGSSCRGAIRGWKNMGVCTERQWPYDVKKASELSVERAIAARTNTLGAYYRLRPDVNDYHAALNEVNAIYVSADVHEGWWAPKIRKGHKHAVIQPASTREGGHAFCIVGYNEAGFLVQNSWGPAWGSKGIALWRYEDWLDHIGDGWVFRLAVPVPSIFGQSSRGSPDSGAEGLGRAPKRLEIAGHFIHFDDGNLKEQGDYWSNADDVQRTAERIRDSAGKYPHVLIYAHGGLNSPKASARRIAALKDGFKRNGIYPLHMMYDTGLGEEISDSVQRALTGRPAGNFLADLREAVVERTDTFIEDAVRRPVTAIWDEIKRGARLPWVDKPDGNAGDGAAAISTFMQVLQETGVRVHLAGHSTGAILLGHLLAALDQLELPDLVDTCSLMAPACTIDFYQEHFAPRLGKGGSGVRLPVLEVYNLLDSLELSDQVGGVYRKSLLYLVSNALERERSKPLLGLEKDARKLANPAALKLHWSDGSKGSVTRSTTHGGFDNDIYTMNSMLKRMLGTAPALPFSANEMKGY